DEELIEINELAEIIADLIGFKLDPIYMPDRPQEVKNATCSADKARKLLDYSTTYNLRQGLQEMIEWISKRGTKKFRYHLELEIVNDKCPDTWKNKLF
ncbi:MAG: epimerase, partial [Candidatus Heimdallarchaeota archaeon]|nr:epimerase [Candidatus Heimdallarchaeota archaeon]